MTFTLPGIQTVASLDPAVIAECGDVVYQIKTARVSDSVNTGNVGISIALVDHAGLSPSDFIDIEITIDPVVSFVLTEEAHFLYINA